MKALSELIEELTRSGGSLENALNKAQVIAHRLGDPALTAWVESELLGYIDGDVPEYRRIVTTAMGTVTNGHFVHNDQRISLSQLTEDERKSAAQRPAREGVGAIEHMAAREAENQIFGSALSPELSARLSKAYTNGYFVQNAFWITSAGTYRQLLSQIRTRLLRFALRLQATLPEDATPEEARQKIDRGDISDLLNGASFGDNNTIYLGHHGSISGIHNSVVRGNFSSLAKYLETEGVAPSTVEALAEAIHQDSVTTEQAGEGLGGRVRGWLAGLGKAVGTSSLTAAAKVAIEEAIRHYYGR